MVKQINKNVRNRAAILSKEEFMYLLFNISTIYIFLELDLFNNFILQLENIKN